MITPKSDFQKHPQFAKGWQTLVDSAQFQEAVYAAKLEMDLQNRNTAQDMGTAAALHWRTQGALQFLDILMNLTRSTVIPKRPGLDNLKHELT